MNISNKTIDESKNMLMIISSANRSLDMAIEIMHRYQRIQEIMAEDLEDIHPLDRDPYRLAKIREVLENVD